MIYDLIDYVLNTNLAHPGSSYKLFFYIYIYIYIYTLMDNIIIMTIQLVKCLIPLCEGLGNTTDHIYMH